MVRGRKSDINTKFHIDFDWWTEGARNFRVVLHSHLCPECRAKYQDYREAKDIDWIDDDTAEVRRVDGLWQALKTHCGHQPDYISAVNAVDVSDLPRLLDERQHAVVAEGSVRDNWSQRSRNAAAPADRLGSLQGHPACLRRGIDRRQTVGRGAASSPVSAV